MPPRYTTSLRGRLPWAILFLQTTFIFIFLHCFQYDYTADAKYLQTYPALQDVNVIIILGFGFLFGSLKKFVFSGVAFNFLITTLGIQWAIIVDSFLFQSTKPSVDLLRLCKGLMDVVPVLISSGVVLGKVNPVQLIVMAAIEVPVYCVNRYIMETYLKMEIQVSMMHVYIFGAYFGLAVSWLITPPSISNKVNKEKEKSDAISDIFSMLGTLFMWMFWPSYNSLWLEKHNERKNAVYNTYFSLAVSAVTVFSLSVLLNPKGKLQMKIIHNAVLAGGVAIGFTAYMLQYPCIAMIIGLLAGLISTLCFHYFQGPLNTVSLVHDTCGVHYTFGLPGLFGSITYVVLIVTADFTSTAILGYQAMVGVACICLTLALGLIGGLITGFLLKCKLWKAPKEWHFFHDQPYWEFPHLASHL
ncbi:rh blood group D antigen S homeolog isoform X1 [Xenopus laevis]|uniref:Rh blood group D antigen S homeolog isoform X1 n=2 Tax=Xenopus laevis TaxID=8355 RepID=A0A1L8H842_XENLA|nr:rh blood group D antigen S homeolog isoform X1 [Xenopus laevis]OCT92206.1 hypothetical protein XELAEV_18015262mg [Xenopus laevis]